MNTQSLKVHIIMTKIRKNRLEDSSLHNKKVAIRQAGLKKWSGHRELFPCGNNSIIIMHLTDVNIISSSNNILI